VIGLIPAANSTFLKLRRYGPIRITAAVADIEVRTMTAPDRIAAATVAIIASVIVAAIHAGSVVAIGVAATV
jgi:hypothetical protein